MSNFEPKSTRRTILKWSDTFPDVPGCGYNSCDQYDGKRCYLTGFEPESVCVPEIQERAERTVPANDLWALIVGHTRYALGRSTYVVDEAVEYVKRWWGVLTVPQKLVLYRDLAEAIDRSNGTGRGLGDSHNELAWKNLYNWMTREMEGVTSCP